MVSIATPLRRSTRLRRLQGNEEASTQSPAPVPSATKNDNKTDATEDAPTASTPAPHRIADSTFITPLKKENAEEDITADDQTTTPMAKVTSSKIPTKTPQTTTRSSKPELQEMHPSKVHHSTTKNVDPGMILGFKPIPKSPGENWTAATPSKTRVTRTDPLESPSYALLKTPTNERIHLSEEARQLMESIRKDAAKIKEEMAKERAEKGANLDNETLENNAVRRIAKAKGISGRFSDIHMAQFKKMDSIENHPSVQRPLLPRVVTPSPKKALKRSLSKAKLDEGEEEKSSMPSSSSRRASKIPRNEGSVAKGAVESTKEALQTESENPSTPIRRTFMPRATTVFHSKVARAPENHAQSADNQASQPRTPQTDFAPKFRTQIPNIKSILRKRQPLFSNDPAKIAAGTHIPPPPGVTIHKWEEKLYGLDDEAPAPSPKKSVVFSPSTKRDSTARLREAIDEVSPTRPKSAGSEVDVPPTVANVPSSGPPSVRTFLPSTVKYPSLPPVTPSPVSAGGTSATQKSGGFSAVPSPRSPSIRASALQKRASGAAGKAATVASPAPAPKSPLVPHTPGQWPSAYAHGLPNKKRHRDQVDDWGNEENTPPIENVNAAKPEEDIKAEKERTPKRVKLSKEPTIHFAPSSTKQDKPAAAAGTSSKLGTVKKFTANKGNNTTSSSTGHRMSTAMAGTRSSAAKANTSNTTAPATKTV
ncbi:hypothetical protein KEM55_002924, partial [Ascosphaera atra]